MSMASGLSQDVRRGNLEKRKVQYEISMTGGLKKIWGGATKNRREKAGLWGKKTKKSAKLKEKKAKKNYSRYR